MRALVTVGLLAVCMTVVCREAKAQVYGIELHNSLMPASGGMGGASVSQPQDVQSALNANPATLTRFDGTQFGFGSAYAEATYNVNQMTPLPLAGVQPFSGKSDTPGSLLPNIGVIHETTILGVPVKLGLGLLTNAGLGVDFRPIAASNGTTASYVALDAVNSVAFNLTPNWSIGAAGGIGTSYLSGPFVGSSSVQTDYAPRFAVGTNYDLGNGFSMGAYWQSKKNFSFRNVVRVAGGPFVDVPLDHPQNVGLGIANSGLMDGKLLLAVDAIFKNYRDTDLFGSLFDDQWVFQTGCQYTLGERTKLRVGYAFNQNPVLDRVQGTIGGVIPVGNIPAVQYIQGQFATINQHRITGGFGMQDVMPNVDLDFFAGGAFEESDRFGNTGVSVQSYWLGFGLTWRFGGCGGCSANSCGHVAGCEAIGDYVGLGCTN